MVKALFNVLFRVLIGIMNIVLLPINAILTTFVPNLSTHINTFNNNITLFVGDSMAWFCSLIPPKTLSLIKVYLTFLIAYYGVSYSVHAINWVLKVIKKLPLT